MSNVLRAKSVVLVSTSELDRQLDRLREAIPELEELTRAYAPTDPRREVIEITLAGAQQAEAWLSEQL